MKNLGEKWEVKVYYSTKDGNSPAKYRVFGDKYALEIASDCLKYDIVKRVTIRRLKNNEK